MRTRGGEGGGTLYHCEKRGNVTRGKGEGRPVISFRGGVIRKGKNRRHPTFGVVGSEQVASCPKEKKRGRTGLVEKGKKGQITTCRRGKEKRNRLLLPQKGERKGCPNLLWPGNH